MSSLAEHQPINRQLPMKPVNQASATYNDESEDVKLKRIPRTRSLSSHRNQQEWDELNEKKKKLE